MILAKELSTFILCGLPDTWESFVRSVSRHDQLPKYDILWAYWVEEEARLVAKDGGHHDENQTLVSRWKGKKKRSFPWRNQGERSDNRYEGRS